MKIVKLLLPLFGILFCSCGSPDADTRQLKSWVLMNNIDDEFKASLSKDFVDQILSEQKIAQFDANNKSLKIEGKMVNPWREYLSKEYRRLYKDEWSLDEDKNISTNLFLPSSKYAMDSINSIDDALEQLCTILTGTDYTNGVYLENRCIFETYFKENKDLAKKVSQTVCKSYVDYIYRYADKNVKVKNWEYSMLSTTDSCTGYYITYEIGKGFYVLIHYVEADNGSEIQARNVYAGKSIIDLEKAIDNDEFNL